MADLKGSDCLSVQECAAVFGYYNRWEQRLVEKAAMKKNYIVEKIASVMDKHFCSREETRLVKGILKIDVLNLTWCIFALCVHKPYLSVVVYCMYLIYMCRYVFLHGCVSTQCCYTKPPPPPPPHELSPICLQI